MGNPNEREDSTTATMVALLLASVMLLGSVAGGLYYYQHQQERATRAAAQQRMAEVQARLAEMVRQRELQTTRTAGSRATLHVDIQIDAAGHLRSEGELLAADQLATWLEQRSPTYVDITADPDCKYRHVLAVQQACRDAGIHAVNVAASVTPSPSPELRP